MRMLVIMSHVFLRKSNLWLSLLLSFSSSVYALTGVGEYRFGPETSENFACEMAMDRAKDNLIVNSIGEHINSFIEQKCIDESCVSDMQTFKMIEGRIGKINHFDKQITTELGQRVCKVTVDGSVEKFVTGLTMVVDGPFSYKENELFNLKAVVNSSGGSFHVFNFHNDQYRLLYSKVQTLAQDEMKIPEKGKFKAVLPKDKLESHEMYLFLYVVDKLEIKDNYTSTEMNAFINSIKPTKRKVIRRYITIRRNL